MIANKVTDSKMQCLEAVKRDGWAIEYLTNEQRKTVIKAIKGEEK